MPYMEHLGLEVQPTNHRIVFTMIHVNDSLLPRGKVWPAWTSWVYKFVLRQCDR